MAKSKNPQQEIGKKGEQIAQTYLKTLGYQILKTNWYFHHYELDIVAQDKDELVIVEVKARSGDRYEHPSEAVTDRKIRFLVNAAEAYIQEYDINLDTRFDVISVIFYGQNFDLEHYKDAFYSTA
ncbi:YraN family protein [Sunxiuqinia sp. A32]|uniref:YraN family protein n=1 Tax=Sunxiuqinia sp. A32 TaxID=3461496 RepID=UPI0040461265